MSVAIPVGRKASVRVPATSANLGPGFDSLGMALSWTDECSVRVIDRGLEFSLSGPGSRLLPHDETHLVVRTILETLSEWDMTVSGLAFEAELSIPLARGLGSSSAAIVAGLTLAWALAYPDRPLDREWAFIRAYRIEGHGDNVGPAILGGFTITWPSTTSDGNTVPQSRTSAIAKNIRALAIIPDTELLTDSARGALPSMVPITDAIANLARSALLVHALADDPALLLEATADRLHQDYRRSLAPSSHAVMTNLRSRGYAALISGAGPTILVLHTEEQSEALVKLVRDLPEAKKMETRILSPGAGVQIL
ncbi:homoserine kinase [Actinomycetaceae bacterium MB13-C1-2]|nr:homoserine kinase [Actinomycetaceae bacterium MB13-C1-2]